MKIEKESDILKPDFRAQVLKEVNSQENWSRKREAKRRYDILRDYTSKYVLRALEQETTNDVLKEISNRVSNISIARKIIDKKAMVYKHGATRTTEDEADQEKLDQLLDLINFNSGMKKMNEYVEAFRNGIGYIFPYQDKNSGKWKIKFNTLSPFLVDVIEDADNPEDARVFLFSYYTNLDEQHQVHAPPNQAGSHDNNTGLTAFRQGDNRDQAIADSPNDQDVDSKRYIWWSTNYHFTTNGKGDMVSTSEDSEQVATNNEIGLQTLVNFSRDQDGHFWALGGDDIFDGAVGINLLMTDIYYIAKYQGMGIGYFFGKGVPQHMQVGPSSFISHEVKDGEPEPKIGFASSNPPIGDHMAMVSQKLEFLLSSNNLEPGSASGKLDTNSAGSGIQEIIKMSENLDDIQDQQEMYKDREPMLIKAAIKWYNWLFDKGLLDDEWKEIGKIDENQKISIQFGHPEPVLSELQKLEVIQKRMDIGLDNLEDAIKRDNPDMDRFMVKKKMDRMEVKKEEDRAKMTASLEAKSEGEPKEQEKKEQEAVDGK